MANNKSLVHYEGECGNVNYDPKMFEVRSGFLRLKEDYKGPIDLPKGCIDISYMFANKDLTGCYFRDFDTSNVKRMAETFRNCKLPEGFSLGDKFDTSNVTNMGGMYMGCKFPEGFSLGNKFNTSKVRNMDSMFWKCEFPKDFTLGDKFDTSNVRVINEIFARCKFHDGFSLGNKFNLSSAEVSHYMFRDSECVTEGKDFYIKEGTGSNKMEMVFASPDKVREFLDTQNEIPELIMDDNIEDSIDNDKDFGD